MFARKFALAGVVLFVALALCLLATAAPIPPSRQKPRVYFPTQVGAKWVYQDGSAEWTQVVKSVEDHDGIKVVNVYEIRGKDEHPRHTMAVSEKGVFSLTKDGAKFRVYYCDLLLPNQKSKFGADGSVMTESEEWGMKLSAPELVEVPAGKFWAVRREGAWRPKGFKEPEPSPLVPKPDPAFVYEIEKWYAPAIGLIKEKMTRQGTLYRNVVLKSFTPGRD